jgi:hypothetical protein
MQRITLRSAAFAAALSLVISVAHAATISVPDNINDFESQKRSDATGGYVASENNLAARAGHQTNFNGSGTNAPGGIMPIYFFQLPALGVGDAITAASFSIGLQPDSASTAVAPTFNGDLYILGLVDTIGKTAADAQNYWYIGNTAQASLPGVAGSATVTATVSRVMDNFLVPADFIANGGTEDASPNTADVTSYIQNLYANPGPNGFTPGTSYLVVRINPDLSPPPTSGTQRYSLANEGNGVNGGLGSAANRPKITLEVVPEPSSILLALVASLGWIAVGSRRLKK